MHLHGGLGGVPLHKRLQRIYQRGDPWEALPQRQRQLRVDLRQAHQTLAAELVGPAPKFAPHG